ncbi:hypothetical protein P7C71_g2101, partial [Lecanoromycetidae sp. Uapishka_2]
MSNRFDPARKAPLSNDLWFAVFKTLSKSSLRTTLQVNKEFYDLALPILYHTVDFSAKPIIDIYGVTPRFWSPKRSINALHIRQWRFAQQILRKPFYGSLVRSFAWTMGFENREHLVYLIDERWDDTVIYKMFSHLILATHITIDTSATAPKTIPNLPALFPSATHLHLGGKTTYAFASSILHNPTTNPLHSLTLENVIEGGLIQDPTSKESRLINRSDTDARERLIHLPENWPPKSLPLQVRPGSMRRLLVPTLLHRCQRLHYLALYKQGQQHEDQIFPSAKYTFDKEIYDEWASFVCAVKPSVLIVAHLKDVERPYSGAPWQAGWGWMSFMPEDVHWPEIAPMDEYFRERLAPVLREGWTGLERLEIRGVSRSVLKNLEKEDGLSGVEVVVKEEVDYAWNATVGK